VANAATNRDASVCTIFTLTPIRSAALGKAVLTVRMQVQQSQEVPFVHAI